LFNFLLALLKYTFSAGDSARESYGVNSVSRNPTAQAGVLITRNVTGIDHDCWQIPSSSVTHFGDYFVAAPSPDSMRLSDSDAGPGLGSGTQVELERGLGDRDRPGLDHVPWHWRPASAAVLVATVGSLVSTEYRDTELGLGRRALPSCRDGTTTIEYYKA
jgi:hypothetical protein